MVTVRNSPPLWPRYGMVPWGGWGGGVAYTSPRGGLPDKETKPTPIHPNPIRGRSKNINSG